jgi:hypothetical protein
MLALCVCMHVWLCMCMFAHTGKDAKGRTIVALVPGRMTAYADMYSANPAIMLRFSVWAFYHLSRSPYFQVNGMAIVESFEGYSMWESRKLMGLMSSGIMGKSMHFSQKALAYRLGGIFVHDQVCLQLTHASPCLW